jgi:hypothetical protein
MRTKSRFLASLLVLLPLAALANEGKWNFAGESQGIAFQLQIRNQCKDGAKVSIRLKSELDRPVTVSFRLNDSDWRKTFSHKLKPKDQTATLHYTPFESTVCHPYIDQVYIESEESVITQNEELPAAEE